MRIKHPGYRVLVAPMIEFDGEFLLCRDNERRRDKWNFPVSEMRLGEAFAEASERIVTDQVGLRVIEDIEVTSLALIAEDILPQGCRHDIVIGVCCMAWDPTLPELSLYNQLEWNWFSPERRERMGIVAGKLIDLWARRSANEPHFDYSGVTL
jgi:ADP-ribose pyrophosphatase YjhB (NUDIX family)